MPNDYFVDSSRNFRETGIFREDGLFGPSRTTEELRQSNNTLHRWWRAGQEQNKTLTTENESLTRQFNTERQKYDELLGQFNTERQKNDELLGRAKQWGLMLLKDATEIKHLKHQIHQQMIESRARTEQEFDD